jgi:hypothetical protein
MPVSMLPARPLDEERFRVLDRLIKNGKGDQVQPTATRDFIKRERIEAQAAKMRQKYSRQPAPEPEDFAVSQETLFGLNGRGMPWCRQCFMCGNWAWCRHREVELMGMFRPPKK